MQVSFFLLSLLLFFSCFFPSLFSFSLSPPPPCRLEFISNQRASGEPSLLITYSFAFLHINNCRVFTLLSQCFRAATPWVSQEGAGGRILYQTPLAVSPPRGRVRADDRRERLFRQVKSTEKNYPSKHTPAASF